MNFKFIWSIALILLLAMCTAKAQNAYRITSADTLPRVLINNVPSINGFATGMKSPNFNNLDYDFDGDLDLVISDGETWRTLVFLGNGDSLNPSFTLFPSAEDIFPQFGSFVKFVDYNHDGLPDIFTGNTNIKVYENIGSKTDGHKFKLIKGKLRYKSNGADFILEVANGDIPSIVDVDGDGDEDVLSFNTDGSRVHYYENISTDKNGLEFELRSECWGSFEEAGTNNSITIGSSCINRIVNKRKQHPGSKLLAFDMENDGDIDLLISDIAYANVVFLENGRVDLNYEIDTIINLVDKFPTNTTSINVPNFPSLSLVDFNFDGTEDLIAVPSGPNPISNGLIWSYINKKQKGHLFKLNDKEFLQNEMIDLGMYAIPAVFDMDGDGDQDMVVGALNHENNDLSKSQIALVWLFENIGSDQSPIFEMIESIQIKNQKKDEQFMSPAFGDINNDGAMDLVIGTGDGTILILENQAKSGEALELKQTKEIQLEGINVQPFVYDYDQDGINDIILGSENGKLSLYLGKGKLDFTLSTSAFGKVNTSATYYTYVTDNEGKRIDSTKYYLPIGASRPVLEDFDRNGNVDLLVGSEWGYLYYYPDISSDPESGFKRDLNIYRNASFGFNYNKNFGQYLTPYPFRNGTNQSIGLMVGHKHGGLEVLKGIIAPVGIEESATHIKMQIYPNPASSALTVVLPTDLKATTNFKLFNNLGQLVLNLSTTKTELTIDIATLPKGMYVMQVSNLEGFGSEQLIIE